MLNSILLVTAPRLNEYARMCADCNITHSSQLDAAAFLHARAAITEKGKNTPAFYSEELSGSEQERLAREFEHETRSHGSCIGSVPLQSHEYRPFVLPEISWRWPLHFELRYSAGPCHLLLCYHSEEWAKREVAEAGILRSLFEPQLGGTFQNSCSRASVLLDPMPAGHLNTEPAIPVWKQGVDSLFGQHRVLYGRGLNLHYDRIFLRERLRQYILNPLHSAVLKSVILFLPSGVLQGSGPLRLLPPLIEEWSQGIGKPLSDPSQEAIIRDQFCDVGNIVVVLPRKQLFAEKGPLSLQPGTPIISQEVSAALISRVLRHSLQFSMQCNFSFLIWDEEKRDVFSLVADAMYDEVDSPCDPCSEAITTNLQEQFTALVTLNSEALIKISETNVIFCSGLLFASFLLYPNNTRDQLREHIFPDWHLSCQPTPEDSNQNTLRSYRKILSRSGGLRLLAALQQNSLKACQQELHTLLEAVEVVCKHFEGFITSEPRSPEVICIPRSMSSNDPSVIDPTLVSIDNQLTAAVAEYERSIFDTVDEFFMSQEFTESLQAHHSFWLQKLPQILPDCSLESLLSMLNINNGGILQSESIRKIDQYSTSLCFSEFWDLGHIIKSLEETSVSLISCVKNQTWKLKDTIVSVICQACSAEQSSSDCMPYESFISAELDFVALLDLEIGEKSSKWLLNPSFLKDAVTTASKNCIYKHLDEALSELQSNRFLLAEDTIFRKVLEVFHGDSFEQLVIDIQKEIKNQVAETVWKCCQEASLMIVSGSDRATSPLVFDWLQKCRQMVKCQDRQTTVSGVLNVYHKSLFNLSKELIVLLEKLQVTLTPQNMSQNTESQYLNPVLAAISKATSYNQFGHKAFKAVWHIRKKIAPHIWLMDSPVCCANFGNNFDVLKGLLDAAVDLVPDKTHIDWKKVGLTEIQLVEGGSFAFFHVLSHLLWGFNSHALADQLAILLNGGEIGLESKVKCQFQQTWTDAQFFNLLYVFTVIFQASINLWIPCKCNDTGQQNCKIFRFGLIEKTTYNMYVEIKEFGLAKREIKFSCLESQWQGNISSASKNAVLDSIAPFFGNGGSIHSTKTFDCLRWRKVLVLGPKLMEILNYIEKISSQFSGNANMCNICNNLHPPVSFFIPWVVYNSTREMFHPFLQKNLFPMMPYAVLGVSAETHSYSKACEIINNMCQRNQVVCQSILSDQIIQRAYVTNSSSNFWFERASKWFEYICDSDGSIGMCDQSFPCVAEIKIKKTEEDKIKYFEQTYSRLIMSSNSELKPFWKTYFITCNLQDLGTLLVV